LLALVWSGVILISYLWNGHQVETLLLDQARTELRANYFKDQTFRLWATGHGGVYVPVTETQKPDPYVEFLPERDAVTPSGKHLTLINPALMVRQFNELAREKYSIEGNISGVLPLNPINKPDAWEAEAYKSFSEGEDEVSEITTFNGAPYLRLIRPMYMAEPCLKCHAHQGFKVGELSGGVSVSVPLLPIQELAEKRMFTLTGGHLFIWLLGLIGISFGRRQILARIDEREVVYASLEDNEARTRSIISSSLDAIVSVDGQGRVTGWNEQASSIFGWQAEEMMGRSLTETIIPEHYRDAHARGLAHAAKTASGKMLDRRVEVSGMRRSGEEFPLELSIVAINIDGQTTFSAFMRDISEKKGAEEKIERDHIAQQLIASVLKTSLQPIPFDERLDEILRQLLAVPWLKLQGKGAIFVVAEDGQTLHMKAHHGMTSSVIDSCAKVAFGECLCGQAAASGEVIWKSGIDHNHNRSHEGMEQHGHYCLPIQSGERLLGVLNLYLDQGHQRSEGEVALLLSVSHAIGSMIQRDEVEKSLLYNAYHDELTGLPNRLLFMDRLEHCMARFARQEDNKFAVLFLDLDRFKVINDSLGHSAGDKILIDVARRLRECSRPDDTVARLGGDEFTILLEDLSSELDVSRVTDRIHAAFRRSFDLGESEVFSLCSIGVAFGSRAYQQPEELLRDADTAMYRAKLDTRASTVYFDEQMHTSALARLTLEWKLRHALENRELDVHYQPIVSASSGVIMGFEALARWPQSDGSMISPVEFIPVAEETGLINEIGLWVLYEACCRVREWQLQEAEYESLYVSVNLSGKQLQQDDLFESIETILEGTDFNPDHLRLEITESTLMDNTEANSSLLTKFRSRGYRFYIDDFGTGYSSLSYLHSFPFEALKVDRSFVMKLDQGDEHINMVETIVAIAHNFNMDVIAEGVETEAQLNQLRELGCERLQGFLFSKPLPASEIPSLLSAPKQWW